jgi:NAD(P)-dependent dehydrogenase (short-subunit alcohol dehydrogenase family)
MAGQLTGKVALVTGGSRGIGAAIAARLAREGADVVVTYVKGADKARAVVAEIEKTGRRGLALASDSADPAAVAAAVKQTVETFGRLDILVNNAGIAIAKPLADYTLEDYDQTMAVNTRSAFIASQAAAAHLGEGGRIINIGSCLAEQVHSPGITLYSMSKSALVALTKGLARDLGARGITVNVVHPGPTDTDMNPADGAFADVQRSQMAIPVYGTGAQVAGLVSYLASPEAQSVTGSGFTIDGGVNA